MPGGGPAERRGRLEQAPVSGAGEAGRSPPPESNTFGSELCSSSHKQTNRVQEGPLPSDPSLLGSRCLSYWCGDSPGPSASHGAAGLLCGRRQRRVPGEGRARRGEAGAEAGGSGAAAAPLPGDSGERAGGAPGRPILHTGQRGREGDPRLAGGHLRDRTAGQGMSGGRQVPGCCREEPGGPHGAVLRPSPVGSPRGRGAAGAAWPRCGSGGAGNVLPAAGAGAQEGMPRSRCAHTGRAGGCVKQCVHICAPSEDDRSSLQILLLSCWFQSF
ncbi:collagen alpha-1(I) chain-like [Corvus moneduloides]|uniref:collagen alpha-1(I) chain-like n=1 Tax=Corvus moneduloides TaxID=1196302 RepID=UPI0013624DC8|nr:collagen alpha-1(I) chain-like [Corvus moneduloides]